MGNRRVVVTGLGVISPVGNKIPDFWKALAEGKSGVTKLTKFDPAPFTSQIAAEVKNFDPTPYIPAKELRRMDIFVQYAMVAFKEMLNDSGLDMSREDPFMVGVLVGSGIGGLHTIEQQYKNYLEKGPSRISPFLIPMLIVNMASGQISITLGAKGPNYSVVTACASGNHAIGGAFHIIKKGEADLMITGGAEGCITPLGFGGFCAAKALSTRNNEPERACRPFDKERDGFIMGEGAGIILLEEEKHAKKRGAKIYAEITGYGMSSDAYHMTAPDPDGSGAAQSMKNALGDAGIKPKEVSYINAHGTSTQLNDKVETLAIKKVFGDYAKKVPISSTKSETGHLLGAAGGIEAIASCLAIKENLIPPTINYEFPDPECDLDYVPNQARKAKVNVALSNSLGFGGHNATLIFKKYIG